MRASIRAITAAGAVAGILDIASAFILSGLRGVSPVRVLQFVASGLIGRRSFAGGMATATLGAALHFLIAFGAAAVFYAASLRLPILTQRPVLSGIVYGLIVWAVMNLVVLPLSAATARHSLSSDLIQIAIHIFLIGLPISFIVRWFTARPAFL